MSETVKYKQMSIYDFLPEGEYQELPPSETVAQVDEAQESSDPSSALDTRKTWEKIVDFEKSLTENNLVFNPEGYSEKVVELDCNPELTEDTDLSLFSVGDTIKVVHPESLYNEDEDPESYHYLKELYGEDLTVENLGKAYLVASGNTLYYKEVIKI